MANQKSAPLPVRDFVQEAMNKLDRKKLVNKSEEGKPSLDGQTEGAATGKTAEVVKPWRVARPPSPAGN